MVDDVFRPDGHLFRTDAEQARHLRFMREEGDALVRLHGHVDDQPLRDAFGAMVRAMALSYAQKP